MMHAQSSQSSQSSTLDRVKTILRRDLKLGPDTPIPDDMPLTGGELDLDSLDVLMVITSIEKEFGLTSLAERGGRETFASIGSLAAYLDSAIPGEAPPPTPAVAVDLAATLDALPHAPPFRFVTRLASLHPGVDAEGIWEVTGDEAFFRGHFPNNPILPGVLIAEALAQLSGIVTASSGGQLAKVDVQFLTPVVPPAILSLHARRLSQIGDLISFDVHAATGDTPVAQGTITLHQLR